MRLLFLFVIVVITLPFSVRAESWPIREDEIKAYCEDPEHLAPPTEGWELKREKANPAILMLEPGEYDYDNGVRFAIYEEGYYVVTLPDSVYRISGTAWHDMMRGKTLGGCSRAQLSDVLGKNDIMPEELSQ